jgi:hypothetical protein
MRWKKRGKSRMTIMFKTRRKTKRKKPTKRKEKTLPVTQTDI